MLFEPLLVRAVTAWLELYLAFAWLGRGLVNLHIHLLNDILHTVTHYKIFWKTFWKRDTHVFVKSQQKRWTYLKNPPRRHFSNSTSACGACFQHILPCSGLVPTLVCQRSPFQQSRNTCALTHCVDASTWHWMCNLSFDAGAIILCVCPLRPHLMDWVTQSMARFLLSWCM